ncbi:peptidyl-prolyl cis-trans isomerase CYP26-2, chloroplastic [Cynara cardunculus var. scolymus]|uniref:peptidyl-prolyl cis-trans isomerase CYP26-2, chloroplastic n=1 Tax=Cynara cardunculus var. scolymus TaxID=59895 RepID=UPI000D625378|nr:peptidyl-prolyl cis-trans isomerase CYP26-2, chloroplastic [Cynara cardunculus var. scolymus]
MQVTPSLHLKTTQRMPVAPTLPPNKIQLRPPFPPKRMPLRLVAPPLPLKRIKWKLVAPPKRIKWKLVALPKRIKWKLVAPGTTQENQVEASGTTQENQVEASGTTQENQVEASGTTQENQVEASGTTSPAEENPVETSSVTTKDGPVDDDSASTTTTTIDSCTEKVLTKRAFLDISIEGKPIGRVVIGLYGNNVPAGTTKFSDFVSGAAGVSYRKKEFIKITPSYVQHGGVRSYGVDAELAAKTGRNFAVDNLVAELDKENGRCPGTKNVAGTIGIIVRDPLKPPPKQKLVARNGKLVIDEEEIGKEPNGTEFVISIKDSPELDASTLVIGKVLEGMEVVEKMGQVKTVQENTSSPYFRVAKLIGDKRAVVAERGFNRPYSKVVITNCGLMA